jgi:hypothetical protein
MRLRALELKLIAGDAQGFQCLLRSNFPSDVIRDMARAALAAAAPARTSRPGNHRTARPATAGTVPVPSHIAYFGGAVALGAERRSLIARYAWPRLMGRRPNPHDYRYAKTWNATGNCNFELTLKTMALALMAHVPALLAWLAAGWYAICRALRLAMPGQGALLQLNSHRLSQGCQNVPHPARRCRRVS